MKKIIYRLSSCILISIIISSCASVPITLNEPQEMFSAEVPSNMCYLRTVRSVRLIGFRTGYNSTGTLVESQYLITAAHNLYDSWITKLHSVQVSCKANDVNIFTSLIEKEDIASNRKVSHYNRDYPTDYAFLKLNEPIPVSNSLTLNRADDLREIQKIEVAGFPGGKLMHGAGQVDYPLPNDYTFYYDVNTKKGMSGGPVWAKYQGEVTLFGIHVSGGRARIVNDELIDDFENWKASFN